MDFIKSFHSIVQAPIYGNWGAEELQQGGRIYNIYYINYEMNTAMESGFSLYLRLDYVASAFFTVVLINFWTIMQSKDVDDKNVSITVKTTVIHLFSRKWQKIQKSWKVMGKIHYPKTIMVWFIFWGRTYIWWIFRETEVTVIMTFDLVYSIGEHHQKPLQQS